MERECDTCKTVRQIERIKVPMRDKDSLTCPVCKGIFMSWNESATYEFSEVLTARMSPTKKRGRPRKSS